MRATLQDAIRSTSSSSAAAKCRTALRTSEAFGAMTL
jgi:hypothetical protein